MESEPRESREKTGRVKNLKAITVHPDRHPLTQRENAHLVHQNVINSPEFATGLELALLHHPDIASKLQNVEVRMSFIGAIKDFLEEIGTIKANSITREEGFLDIFTKQDIKDSLYPKLLKLNEFGKASAKLFCNQIFSSMMPAVYSLTAIKMGYARVKKSSGELYGDVVSPADVGNNDGMPYLEFRRLEQQSRNALEAIAAIQFTNPDRRQVTLHQLKTAEHKRYLLSLIHDQNLETLKKENIAKLAQIWSDILSDKTIKIYLLNNFAVISDEILQALKSGTMNLTITTCPDYSGTVNTSENGTGVFEYDFKTLGSGGNSQMQAGIVTEKGFDFAVALSTVMKKHIPNVSLQHLLPTFEFGQSGFKELSKADTDTKLQEQATIIANRYADIGTDLSVSVGLFKNEIVSDEIFWERRDQLAQDIVTTATLKEGKKGRRYASHLKFVLQQRKALYQKWYPKQENETDADWEQRLLQQVALSVAEYVILPQLIKASHPQGSGTIILDCSSAHMISSNQAGLMSEKGDPVIHGYGAKSGQYAGD